MNDTPFFIKTNKSLTCSLPIKWEDVACFEDSAIRVEERPEGTVVSLSAFDVRAKIDWHYEDAPEDIRTSALSIDWFASITIDKDGVAHHDCNPGVGIYEWVWVTHDSFASDIEKELRLMDDLVPEVKTVQDAVRYMYDDMCTTLSTGHYKKW